MVDAATGKQLVRQQAKAYMFSSPKLTCLLPAVAGDVVFIGVLNGTLEARDAKTGDLLWDYQIEKSKENKAWVLTSDRKMNLPLLFYSNWRENPIVARQSGIWDWRNLLVSARRERRGLLRKHGRIFLGRAGIAGIKPQITPGTRFEVTR